MAGLGGLLALFLAIASKKLYVYEDPRIEQVEALLPHSNCGACGTAGCHNFAEQAVAGQIEPGRCSVNSPDQNKNIAALLGVALGDVEKRVARLAAPAASMSPQCGPSMPVFLHVVPLPWPVAAARAVPGAAWAWGIAPMCASLMQSPWTAMACR